LALDDGGCLVLRFGYFTLGKGALYLLYRRLGRPWGQSGRVLKILCPHWGSIPDLTVAFPPDSGSRPPLTGLRDYAYWTHHTH